MFGWLATASCLVYKLYIEQSPEETWWDYAQAPLAWLRPKPKPWYDVVGDIVYRFIVDLLADCIGAPVVHTSSALWRFASYPLSLYSRQNDALSELATNPLTRLTKPGIAAEAAQLTMTPFFAGGAAVVAISVGYPVAQVLFLTGVTVYCTNASILRSFLNPM